MMGRMKDMRKYVSTIIVLCSILLLTVGCSNGFLDKSLKTKAFKVSEEKVKGTTKLLHTNLTDIYDGIDDMYADSDYVVSGVIKDIEYFEVESILLRKINVLIKTSYKGAIEKDILISVVENDGYVRLKSMYEELKKKYEDNNGPKEKEEALLLNATYRSRKEDITNDMLIRITLDKKQDSKIGDELLLFLTDSSEDTYKNKKVQLAFDHKLSYPKGAYVTLGLFMGKFTLDGDTYKRYQWYFTRISLEANRVNEKVTECYSIQEMEEELKKVK